MRSGSSERIGTITTTRSIRSTSRTRYSVSWAQRLARTLCQECRESYHPAKEEYNALAYGFGEEAFAGLQISYDDNFVLYRGKGCPSCRNTGYKGRVALHELLLISDEIKKLIHTRATATELFKWRGRRK